MHCQWGRKPLPGDTRCGLSSSCTEPQTQGTCAKNLVKIARVVVEISLRTDRQTDRQTDPQTDIFITLLCNSSRGQSNKSTQQPFHDHYTGYSVLASTHS